jgi:hypothetical protein
VELISKPHTAGHEVVDFVANKLDPSDNCPDFVVPLAEAVAS